MFRGKGRNWALNIGTGIGIIEESACERSKVEKEKKKGEIERKREMRGRSVGREGEILRWSYAGNGVRHLTGGWRGCIVRKVDGKAG